MGSIPLPALNIKTPQQPDLLEKYGQLMALRNAQQGQQQRAALAPLQQQQAQQNVQLGAGQLQQQQQQLTDQKAMTAAMQSWDGKDYTQLPALVIKNGGSATAVMGLKKQILDQQTAVATQVKDQGQGALAQIGATMKKNDLITGALAPLVDPSKVPDDQLPQTLTSTVRSLVQQGALDPQHAQAAQQIAQSGNPVAIRQGIDHFRKTLMAQSQITDDAAKQATIQNQQAERAQAAATAAETARHNAVDEKTARARLSVEGARLKFQESQAGISPNGTPNPLAQAIATGHVVPDRMGYLLTKNPGLIQGVMAVDPSFDVSKAQTYPTTYKDFTSGKTSVALNSGGTALTHLQELSAMNTDASHIPGTPAYNAYQNKADTVASELAKFYGDATIPAIASIKKTLTATLPGNRQAAIETQAKSMGDKLDAYQQTWENAAPSKAYQAPMPGISPKALAARAALDPTYKAPSAAGSQPATPAAAPSGTPVGATKKFPNGKTGTWDGHGWVAK